MIGNAGQAPSVEGTVIDLSEGGWKATVSSPADVQTGMILTLYFSVPTHATPIRVDLATVRWSREGEFGVEFLFMESGEEFHPKELVTIEEVTISTMWEMAALVEVLERKGMLTRQEIYDTIHVSR